MKPISVNFHLWKPCNYHCRFCFATFPDIEGALTLNDAKRLLFLLREAGAEKLNFAGGEPTLHPNIGELVAESHRLGFITSLVSNGARMTQLLEKHANEIDWVALSVDSASEVIQKDLGRGNGNHVIQSIALFDKLHQYSIRVKLNTVVTNLNHLENMSAFVRRVRPERWKIFQVLPVQGQNDGSVEDLLISPQQFQEFVERHQPLIKEGFQVIPESNDLMKDSYVMVNPQGQFYNITKNNGHSYSSPILEVGVSAALAQVGWNIDAFLRRGGIYSWK
ncbi:viperin family antiviral radical SAM protein [Nodularia sphaerocarpa]|uniref:viperin family antiviral radical SAM protein n=1 Tax=Nodularia sphaerocarpa TaxID=137816 RepID=UPI00232C4057|nr:viperin family antiviral radical SAM protein [Nodularia sphaerocarpa]MDB9372320.1 viperin family antiviral radical SAM protein [Nodularia sphaerocarpa CS-585]MDB9377936.1 viperin family antiviral radical SAM protein [Nodularia sphaerocarpa CS-585A2]